MGDFRAKNADKTSPKKLDKSSSRDKPSTARKLDTSSGREKAASAKMLDTSSGRDKALWTNDRLSRDNVLGMRLDSQGVGRLPLRPGIHSNGLGIPLIPPGDIRHRHPEVPALGGGWDAPRGLIRGGVNLDSRSEQRGQEGVRLDPSKRRTNNSKEMASRQLRFDSLSGTEQEEQEAWAKEQIAISGSCADGYEWCRVKGGYRCRAGGHAMTDQLLADGKRAYYKNTFGSRSTGKRIIELDGETFDGPYPGKKKDSKERGKWSVPEPVQPGQGHIPSHGRGRGVGVNLDSRQHGRGSLDSGWANRQHNAGYGGVNLNGHSRDQLCSEPIHQRRSDIPRGIVRGGVSLGSRQYGRGPVDSGRGPVSRNDGVGRAGVNLDSRRRGEGLENLTLGRTDGRPDFEYHNRKLVIPPAGKNLRTTEDREMASRQTRYANLSGADRQKQDDWARGQISLLDICPMNFDWYRISGGMRCRGGNHLMTDALLAEGSGGYWETDLDIVKITNKKVLKMDGGKWVGPYYGKRPVMGGNYYGGGNGPNRSQR